jgi:hypothetical protein
MAHEGLPTAVAAARPEMIAFTICARNFLAQAKVLHEGLRTHYPDISFHVVLCDALEGIDFDTLPFDVIDFASIGIPGLAGMIDSYNITELNTAIKPFAFLELFSRWPGSAVIYFDPDIMVLSRLEELDASLSDGKDCVLTPHLCEPAEFAELDDGKMLIYGAYNLGFCALRDTLPVRRVLEWWGRRLERQCVIDLASGLFVDQKWADLLPSFIENTKVLRHPGYNVAYWNLSQRSVRRRAGDGIWLVNGQHLRFFHFSGSVVDEPRCFSRHSFQFRNESIRDANLLFDEYCRMVDVAGRRSFRSIPYAFNWDGASGRNEHTPRAGA